MDEYKMLEDSERRENYKYRHKETGKLVTVKTLRLQSSHGFGIPCKTLRKISLLKEIHHDNVARLLDVIYDERLGHVHLLSEYADLAMRTMINHNPVKAKDGRFIRNPLEQILRGLYCYHSIGAAHGNLNPTNVIVDCANLTVKLTDLDTKMTPSYKAPELLYDSSAEVTPASDMFSVGCIFAEMLTQKPLFDATLCHEIISVSRLIGNSDGYDNEPPEETRPAYEDDQGTESNLSSSIDKIERDRIAWKLEKIIPNLIPPGIDLLSRMLCLNPSKRITVEQALKHPYIKSGVRLALGSL